MKTSHTVKTETVTPRATYQDVLDAPPHQVAEIVDGALYIFSRPAPMHHLASSALGSRIGPPFHFGDGGPGGWWILDEPELHLGDDIVVPDLAGWRRERLSVLPTTAYYTLAPDWVCEILSPSTRQLDLGSKRAVCAGEKVSFIWFVDPSARSLEACELHGEGWKLIDTLFDDAQVSLPPFEAISFSLGDLWLPPAVHKGVPAEQPGRSTTASESEAVEASV